MSDEAKKQELPFAEPESDLNAPATGIREWAKTVASERIRQFFALA